MPRFFFQRFFIGHISAHKPSFQLNFGGKEDLVVLYILVEVDWHLVLEQWRYGCLSGRSPISQLLAMAN